MTTSASTPKFDNYASYKQVELNLNTDLRALREYCKRLNLAGNAAALDDAMRRLEENIFKVGVIGEFKRGKSTLINALVGESIMPTSVLPATATINRLTYSPRPFAQIIYKDGHQEEVDVDDLSRYVTKLTEDAELTARNVQEAVIHYPAPFCRQNVDIIDTPGLNDDKTMTEVTLAMLPLVDAAVMVIMAQAPFSNSERDILENKILAADLGRVLFVVTGIDMYSESESQSVLDSIEKRIREMVLAKAARVWGEDSPEFRTYRHKLGDLRIFGVSARQALEAKQMNNTALLEQSRMPVFEKALEHFLTEERGVVSLALPVNRIRAAAQEITQAVALRNNVLAMGDTEFNDKYEQAMREISGLRTKREAELVHIRTSGQAAIDRLRPRIDGFWPTLEQAGQESIDAWELTVDELKNPEDASAKLFAAAKNALGNAAQTQGEIIQNEIFTSLEKETERLEDFEADFSQTLEKIHDLFTPSDVHMDDEANMALCVALNLLVAGGGGVFQGYKVAGWKGALLGGVASGVGIVGGAVGLGVLLSLLSLPLSFPVILIGTLTTAVVGVFTGKSALNWAFGEKRVAHFKEKAKEALHNQILDLQIKEDIKARVEKQVQSAFDALADKITHETERILSDMENTLNQLREDLSRRKETTAVERKELTDILSNVGEIAARAEQLAARLAGVNNPQEPRNDKL